MTLWTTGSHGRENLWQTRLTPRPHMRLTSPWRILRYPMRRLVVEDAFPERGSGGGAACGESAPRRERGYTLRGVLYADACVGAGLHRLQQRVQGLRHGR